MSTKPSAILEKIFFYGCLGVSLYTIISSISNPTLDGPSHLYNARMADYLMKNNGFTGKYFARNPLPVANLTDHYIMVVLCNFMSFASVEKVLQVLCVAGFSLAFRLLVKQFNTANLGLSIFAIPFSFSFLYYLGFYNFLLSFPLLFLAISLYKARFTNKEQFPPLWSYCLLTVIVSAIYVTNGLAFLYAGFILLAFEVFMVRAIQKAREVGARKLIIKRLVAFSLTWVPGLICFVIFLAKIKLVQPDHDVTFGEHLKWLAGLRPLLVYRDSEVSYARGILGFILLALATAIYFRVKNKTLLQFNLPDIFFITFLFTSICYFVIPDGSSVGMMSNRLCHYLFVYLLLWIACQNVPLTISWISGIGIMVIHFMFLVNAHMPVQAQLNKEAGIIKHAAQMVKENSIVLDIDVTDNWLMEHFGDYIGEDKPLLIIPDYEPGERWFGVIWKDDMPTIRFDSILKWDALKNVNSHENEDVGYVFIYGDYNKVLHYEDWLGLRMVLARRYNPCYFSPDSTVHIFKLNNK